jgi:pimeloyl-ACP methyl ester carboxylesterase
VECGFVTVPEDRTAAGSATIRLHVAVFKSKSLDAASDPVVYLEGGPGAKALGLARLSFAPYYSPFLNNRDFIMFDQRGVGFSEPALDCPEYVAFSYDILDEGLSVNEATDGSVEAVERCRDHLLATGVDLRAYTSAESAADVNDIRVALGYDEWNLYRISYGTKLALTVMRNHPEGVRSVILDSVYPLEVNLYTSFLDNVDRAFSTLFRACESDPACSERYPGLEKTFYKLVAELDAEPLLVTIRHPITREDYDVLITGDRMLEFLFFSMHSTGLIPHLPQAVSDAAEGRLQTMAALHGNLLVYDLFSTGMHLSLQCGEELSFTSGDDIARAADTHPRLRGLLERDPTFDQCAVWESRKSGPVENQPGVSDIPTLVLAGEMDLITPPQWARVVGGDLSRSYAFEFPGVGHGAST